jgi:hypothetical protein
MKRIRAFFDHFTGGHRPPTGPLTTAEESDAEALRQQLLSEEHEPSEGEQGEGEGGPSHR